MMPGICNSGLVCLANADVNMEFNYQSACKKVYQEERTERGTFPTRLHKYPKYCLLFTRKKSCLALQMCDRQWLVVGFKMQWI